MRIFKAFLLTLFFYMICTFGCYWLAEIMPMPFSVARLLPVSALMGIGLGAFYLGYSDKGTLLLRTPLYCLLCLLLQLAAVLYIAGEYISPMPLLLYTIAVFLLALPTVFTARLIYLRNMRKNKE